MAPRKEHFLEKYAAQKPDAPQAFTELVHAAKVNAELLVGDAKWDTFLSHLQATRDTDVLEANRFTELLKRAVGNDVIVCQINIAIREERVKLMDEIMQLPSRIVKAANGTEPRTN